MPLVFSVTVTDCWIISLQIKIIMVVITQKLELRMVIHPQELRDITDARNYRLYIYILYIYIYIIDIHIQLELELHPQKSLQEADFG